MDKKVIIHGHFYQPPRENPWSGEIMPQPTASPADNWNQRILYECYKPNTSASIRSPGGTRENVNNFKNISFNIGPTLATWMSVYYIETYKKIIGADTGTNAIALPYNHTILPLDNKITRKVQIEWGIREFEMRYNRRPASIWLPECAVSYDVVNELIKRDMKFLILTSGQAEAVRKINSGKWHDVSGENIDTGRPYRLFTDEGFIEVFFSNHKLSMEISFDKLLNNPAKCAGRIETAFETEKPGPRLLTIATDGETFGHHHEGGEKGLAYLINYELPARGIEVTTYQDYLENYPVEWEVRIKNNSSWSCKHGIQRWKSACGCGKEEGSDLNWRGPLRESLAWLNEEIIDIFYKNAGKYFKINPEDIIIKYVDVLTDYSAKESFFKRFVKKEYLNNKEVNLSLEVILNAFFMLTSCGWFFGKLTRPEPVKNLSYALRAIKLTKKIWGIELEDKFYRKLNRHPDTEYVWNNLVKNQPAGPEDLVNKIKDIYKFTGFSRFCLGRWIFESERGFIKGKDIRTGEEIRERI